MAEFVIERKFTRLEIDSATFVNHDSVLKALGIPEQKAMRIYPHIGNVGSSSVALTLKMLVEQERVKRGDTVAMMGIGSGLNVSMMSVDW